MEITPTNITEAINNAPPFQRREIANKYEGISVNWETFFYFVNEATNKQEIVNLILQDIENTFIFISCEVNLLQYPELKVMKEGQRLFVKGVIDHVGYFSNGIYLKNCELKFVENERPIKAEGVEIYARNILNNGVITSDRKTKVVTDNYKGTGELSSFSKRESKKEWYQKWWGQALIALVITVLGGIIVALII